MVAEDQLAHAVSQGVRASILGLVVSAVLAVIKLGAGVFGNSYALIADGLESTFDIFAGLLVWSGLRVGGKAPSASFPYGRGKADSLAALAVATMLVAGGVGIAAGAIHEIVIPHPAPAFFTLPVLVLVVMAKEGTFRFLNARGHQVGSQGLQSDAWHHRSDAITSLAAFVGISISVWMGPGYESADDWAALFACLVIFWNGGRLGRTAVRDILDAAAPEHVHERIRQIASAVPGVEGIDDLRVRRSGLALFVDIHVEVDGGLSVKAGHDIAHHVKDDLLHSELPVRDALIHVEPAGDG